MMSLNFYAADSVLLVCPDSEQHIMRCSNVGLVHGVWRGTLVVKFCCVQAGGLVLPLEKRVDTMQFPSPHSGSTDNIQGTAAQLGWERQPALNEPARGQKAPLVSNGAHLLSHENE